MHSFEIWWDKHGGQQLIGHFKKLGARVVEVPGVEKRQMR